MVLSASKASRRRSRFRCKTGAARTSRVGGQQGRGVVHAIADHRDALPPLLDPPELRGALLGRHLGLDRVGEAIDLADELCNKTLAIDRYYSAYQRRCFFVGRSRGDTDAVEDLRAAYESCLDPKDRTQLAEALVAARESAKTRD